MPAKNDMDSNFVVLVLLFQKGPRMRTTHMNKEFGRPRSLSSDKPWCRDCARTLSESDLESGECHWCKESAERKLIDALERAWEKNR